MTAIRQTIDTQIIDFYTDAYDEAGRLQRNARGRVERLRTLELLDRHLPAAPARVLDIGGGPGVYAAELAARGHQVTLLDPVPFHVEQASRHGSFTAAHGDARRLEQPDASVDVALLLGPLYHLTDREERVAALREARRVVRPGGVVLAAVISRHSPLLHLSALGRLPTDEAARTLAAELAESGVNDPATGFTVAYFHTAAELRSEYLDAGLDDPELYGVEGPLWPLLASELVEDREDLITAATRAARAAEQDPALLASSAHLLAAARV
ncbi:class I SAM-dependent methyltransferase [Streptacidiphilus pinicola]|uniref:Class I SAM-dependent methyltransferase n=1 Tax=Streptacidiphilus pinicola TaxID=2219663 RepID=A0A2X0IRY7_9ACTN|nr:class I SAM-dependent methyltransferase [Streptacidiphilus pinicola]RAG86373.1 class I SAM-dependent methyltransferase [Streptacidiphilus pinicola]